MRYALTQILWLLTDMLLFIGAFSLAYFLRVGWVLSTDFPFDRFLLSTMLAAPVWLLVLATTRTFTLPRNQITLRNGLFIGYSCLVGVAVFTLIYYFAFTAFFSRLLLMTAWVLSTIATWVWHICYDQLRRFILRSNPPAFPTLIVGVTRESKKLIEELNRRKSPLKPVAILDGRGTSEKEIDGVPVKGKLKKLEEILENEGITHLIQCSDLEQSLNLLSASRQRGITYMLLPSVLGIVERDGRVDTLEGHPVTMVRPQKWRALQWLLQ